MGKVPIQETSFWHQVCQRSLSTEKLRDVSEISKDIIADDMIIAATSTEEHDAILQKVMETARRANIRFK